VDSSHPISESRNIDKPRPHSDYSHLFLSMPIMKNMYWPRAKSHLCVIHGQRRWAVGQANIDL